jgi:hypothetical protein
VHSFPYPICAPFVVARSRGWTVDDTTQLLKPNVVRGPAYSPLAALFCRSPFQAPTSTLLFQDDTAAASRQLVDAEAALARLGGMFASIEAGVL